MGGGIDVGGVKRCCCGRVSQGEEVGKEGEAIVPAPMVAAGSGRAPVGVIGRCGHRWYNC